MTTSPLYVAVTYTVKCAACHKTEEQSFAAMAGQQIRSPSAPFGWKVVNGMAICPDHDVRLTASARGETVDLPV